MTDPDLSSIVSVAQKLADAAHAPALQFFRLNGLSATSKDDKRFDPVTEGDRAVERAIRDQLRDLRPEDAILGEEFGTQDGTSGIQWIIDPIDGTRAYLCGAPTWGTLIAAASGDEVLCGIIEQPFTGERFIGAGGKAEWMHGEKRVELSTRATTDLSDVRLMTTFPEVGRDQDRAGFQTVEQHVQLTRYGLDCYAYGLLASGQIDMVIEAGLASYDIAGPIGVIQGAGGVVTTWSGGNATNGGQVVASANAKLHDAALEILKEFAD